MPAMDVDYMPPTPKAPKLTRENGEQLIEAIDARDKAKEQLVTAQRVYDEQNRRLYQLIHELQGEY